VFRVRAGLAVGAAALLARRKISVSGGHWAFLGPDEKSELAPEFSQTDSMKEQFFQDDESLIRWIVSQLCQKKIVGLCHGRMEFGPRALGNRSLIADPRHAEMKDLINRKIKHREPFRPFAASVLSEYQDAWFENAFYCPAMEAVFNVKNSSKIPAVVHVDNTCRIQTVRKDTQPFFWALLEHFRKKTGVPLLLNTSFNEREPIVCSHKDAIRCFMKSGIDCLVMGRRSYIRIEDALALTA